MIATEGIKKTIHRRKKKDTYFKHTSSKDQKRGCPIKDTLQKLNQSANL